VGLFLLGARHAEKRARPIGDRPFFVPEGRPVYTISGVRQAS